MKGFLWFWLEFNWWMLIFILCCCFTFCPRFIKLGKKGKTESRFKWFNRIQQVSQIKRVKLKEIMYIWPMNNMGLNCTGPFIYGFFSISTIVPHNLWLAESMDAELWIWKNHRYRGTMCGKAIYKLYADLWLLRGSVPLTCSLFKGQLCILKIKWTKANWEETFQRLTYKENGSLCWPQVSMSPNYGLIA